VDLILDTNALSAYAEGDRDVVAQLRASRYRAIPAIVFGEFRFGILQSRFRHQHERWLARELADFDCLAVDEHTAVHYAEIRLELKMAGTPIPVNDLWIAALTRQHGFALLSRDHHFDRVAGLQRLSW
jgi:tRNA(fMet)-specific endonuclease VapC